MGNVTKTGVLPQVFRRGRPPQEGRNTYETELWDDISGVVFTDGDDSDVPLAASTNLDLDSSVVGSPVPCVLEITASAIVEWTATAAKAVAAELYTSQDGGATFQTPPQGNDRWAIPVTSGLWRVTMNPQAVATQTRAGLYIVRLRVANGSGNSITVVDRFIKIRRGRVPAA